MAESSEKRLVWDILTRVFHWSLAVAVVTGWGLGKFGPTILTYHYYVGYLVAALLVFRVVWGFVGPKPVQFRSFIYGPAKTIAYLRRMPSRSPSNWPGHNPVGALSVFALIGVLGAQIATGLIADPDDFINAGPLASQVEFSTARWAAGMHYYLSNILLGLVALHIGAILFYRFWKRENLIGPMITGWKDVRKDHPDA